MNKQDSTKIGEPQPVNNLSDSIFVVRKENLYSELNSEGVILSLTNGKYYGINEIGAYIWEILQKPATFNEIQNLILEDYDVDLERCNQAVSSFLNEMIKENLIEILDEKTI